MVVLNVMRIPNTFIGGIRSCLTEPRYFISINGGLAGYFKGRRGIRQGDSLFLYIFVIVMNVLSKLLDAATSHGVFNYHPKCHKVKLTHLCFVDDLLIFSKGNVDFIAGIQKVLQKLYAFFGLQLNNAKIELLSFGVLKAVLEEI